MSANAVRKMIRRYGETWTIRTFTEGAKDDYGDPTLTPSNSSIKVIRHREAPEAGEVEMLGETGRTQLVDLQLVASADDEAIPKLRNTDEDVVILDPDGTAYTLVRIGRVEEFVGGLALFLIERRVTT